MSDLFKRSPGAGWLAEHIPDGGAVLAADGAELLLSSIDNADRAASVVVPADNAFALVSRPGTTLVVNGVASPGGIRLLRDRDEIVLGGDSLRRFFFSTECKAEPQTLPPELEDACCPRCQQKLREPIVPAAKDGEDDAENTEHLVIACASCHAWYHYPECWQYEDACSLCPAPTVSHRPWTPENLEKPVS